MDITSPEIHYALLIIPMLFALAVLGQGVMKVINHEPDGKVALGFGLVLLGLIGAAYFFFIR